MWGVLGLLYVAALVALLLTVAVGAPWVSLVIIASAAGLLSFAWLTR